MIEMETALENKEDEIVVQKLRTLNEVLEYFSEKQQKIIVKEASSIEAAIPGFEKTMSQFSEAVEKCMSTINELVLKFCKEHQTH